MPGSVLEPDYSCVEAMGGGPDWGISPLQISSRMLSYLEVMRRFQEELLAQFAVPANVFFPRRDDGPP